MVSRQKENLGICQTSWETGWEEVKEYHSYIYIYLRHRHHDSKSSLSSPGQGAKVFTARPPSILQGHLRLPSVMLRRKCVRSLHSLKKVKGTPSSSPRHRPVRKSETAVCSLQANPPGRSLSHFLGEWGQSGHRFFLCVDHLGSVPTHSRPFPARAPS